MKQTLTQAYLSLNADPTKQKGYDITHLFYYLTPWRHLVRGLVHIESNCLFIVTVLRTGRVYTC